MEKKIEDYLNLYIGTECAYDPGRKVLGEPEPIFPIYWSNLEYVFNGIMDGKFKLAVRPLSDMTEEECIKANELSGDGELEEDFNLKNYYTRKAVFFEPEEFRYLLSIGIDLFGLIEAGLAIDKTTIPQAK